MHSVDNDHLQLTKKPADPDPTEDFDSTQYAKGFFDDAFTYTWPTGIRPRHVHFEVSTTMTDIETCGVHFFNLEFDPENQNVEDGITKQRRF